jgi:hypothetical protein
VEESRKSVLSYSKLAEAEQALSKIDKSLRSTEKRSNVDYSETNEGIEARTKQIEITKANVEYSRRNEGIGEKTRQSIGNVILIFIIEHERLYDVSAARRAKDAHHQG